MTKPADSFGEHDALAWAICTRIAKRRKAGEAISELVWADLARIILEGTER